MNEIISVIIPIYNGESTLEKCVYSILNSKYSNLEIILVNDGSTDKSRELCDNLTKKDFRISVYHLKNGGVSHARNIGISHAKGEYYTFIDCDDYVTENYFLDLYNNIKCNKSDLAVGSIANVYGSKTTYVYAEECVVDLSVNSKESRRHFLELNQSYLLYGPVNKLYIADYIKNNNIRFPEDMSYGEDLMFNLEYMHYCNLISYSKEPIYYYDHSNELSLSQKYRVDLFETGLKINQALMYFFKKIDFWGVDESKYIYRRIFDDAYNTIFTLWNPKYSLPLRKKLQRIDTILNNKEVCKSYSIADTTDYSRLYVSLMIKKHSLAIILLMEIRKVLNCIKGLEV